MINSRALDDLLPQVRNRTQAFIDAARAQGIELRPICTYRDFAFQASLYAIGRTVPGEDVTASRPMGRTVTNSGPGESWHNWKCAVDLAPFDAKGKPIWKDAALWNRIGEMGESMGFEWGGRWKGVDGPHFQFREGRTIKGMLAAHPKGLA